jgi:serine/threonine-protein kinase
MPASGFEGLLTGHTLADRYHVDEVIGRGGFAAVYRATDQRLGRTVAIKVITQSSSSPEMRAEMQRRFEREARAIAMLHHPNVVTVYDFGADPVLGLDFLVMELLRGEVLSDRLKRAEPIPVPEALRILRDAAFGVDAGHRAGLIHRDIKPGNIFLAQPDHGGPPRVCVLDFGIARFTEASDVTQLTHSGGRGFLSPAYASPEQLRGDRPITPAADVFSLGVIGYHLLAREKPFQHDRLHPGPYAKPPAPLLKRNPDVPTAVAAVIEQAMREDPAERFADAGAFVAALRAAVAAAEAEGAAAVAPAVVITPEATQLQLPEPEPAVDVAVASQPEPQPEPEIVAAADLPPRDEPVADHREADVVPPPVYAAAPPVAAAPVAPAEPPVVPHRPTAVDEARRDVPPAAPARPTSTRPARRTNPALIAIPVLLAIVVALWLTMRGGDDGRVANAPAATEPGSSSGPAASDPAGPQPGSQGATGAGQVAPGGTPAAPGGVTPAGEPAAGGIAPEPETPAPGASSPPAGSGPAVAPPAAREPAGRVPAEREPAARPSTRPSSPPPAPSRTGTAASAGGAGARALNRQGEALFDRGNVSGAIERFREAVSAAPGNAYYRNNLGWALFQAGRVDEAGRELNEAVRLDPGRDIAYANIGEVERARGNIAGAIAAYERFLELNTDPRREQIAREKLRRLRGG